MTCSIVIVPQPQLAGEHLHFCAADVHEQSAQVAQPQSKEGGEAALADMMAKDREQRCDGER